MELEKNPWSSFLLFVVCCIFVLPIHAGVAFSMALSGDLLSWISFTVGSLGLCTLCELLILKTSIGESRKYRFAYADVFTSLILLAQIVLNFVIFMNMK